MRGRSNSSSSSSSSDGSSQQRRGRDNASERRRHRHRGGKQESTNVTTSSSSPQQEQEQMQLATTSAAAAAGGERTTTTSAVAPPQPSTTTTTTGWRVYWENWQDFRTTIGQFVNHKKVQFFIVWLIAINAMMMGIGTSDAVKGNERARDAFEAVDKAFLIVFTIELGMQFTYHGWKILIDGWLLFDTIIIVISWAFAEVQIIRAFRIFRALRLITRIKVMKNLILALFGVIPRMLAIGVLLFLVSYIFAVMFTQLFKDLYEEEGTDSDYFGSMDKTFFTLFQIMTLDAWAAIARQVMDTYPWAWLPFIIFVIITGFVVVNLMIAVICDSIAALHDDDKAKLHGYYDDEDSNPSQPESNPGFIQGNVQEQLDALEDQVDELSRMQEETLLALETLAQQLQIQRAHKEVNAEVAVRASALSAGA